ncbi:MAG: D-alanine--D-alanine ligase [Candidatus Melainabacteria bacterium]|nr:D-alanine--D-alanine ligase [Candidatus Melainabacteria bacterium]
MMTYTTNNTAALQERFPINPKTGFACVPKTAKIAVLCGGASSERDVSLRSGKNCIAALHRLGYNNAVLVDVDRYIAHYLVDSNIEVAYIAMHGEQGEDGAIQGLLEILGIPYTGNGIQANAITMDKSRTKQLLKENGIPVLPSLTFYWSAEEGGDLQFMDKLMQEVGFPMMVKPVGTGSSVGMSKVDSPDKLADALDDASGYSGGQVMVERFAVGKDLTVGSLLVEGRLQVTPILEIRPKTGWYDYEAKYTAGMTAFILPAELTAMETVAVQEMALKAHKAVGCHGVSRTDFVWTTDGFFVLEINSIPGMTDLSDLPAQCKAMGMSYDELVEALLQSAVVTPAQVAGLAPHPIAPLTEIQHTVQATVVSV